MLKPFAKSHNTACRLLAVLLYGPESGLAYLTLLNRTDRRQTLSIRTGAAAYSMRMTIPRFKEHLDWLHSIGLIENWTKPQKGEVLVTVLLPESTNYGIKHES